MNSSTLTSPLRTVLFIHGYGTTDVYFNKIKQYPKNFEIITLRLPFDQLLEGQVPTIEGYIKLVNDFVDQKHLENFDVVGHSLGGAIALGVKKAHKKILIAPLNPFTNAKQKWLLPQNLIEAKEGFENIVYQPKKYWSTQQIIAMAHNHLNFTSKNQEYLQFLVKEQIINKHYLSKAIAKLYGESKFTIIMGTEDGYISNENIDWVVKEYNSKVYKIKRCGHSPVFETPQRVVELIEQILEIDSLVKER